jgi:mannose-6-phosphate isomerase
VIVAGRALVTLDDVVHERNATESIEIGQGVRHRIENPGPEPMTFIEVQTGTYFGEDDIVRLDDDYGRDEAAAG